MTTYAITVLFIIVSGAAIMSLIFYRMKVLNLKTLLSIVIASMISAFTLPGIFYLMSAYRLFDMKSSAIIIAALAAIAIYILFVFILSLIISHIVPKISIGSKKADATVSEAAVAEGEALAGTHQDENYLEKIFANYVGADNNISMNNEENTVSDENNFEKSVDSTENIDKMGIENTLQDRNNMSIEECIEEAFRLKEQGDFEGAIIYCMYALDKKPNKDLAFWMVLDICLMYKSLGQRELALDILNSYYDTYGGIMDISVKEEIENYLSDI